MPSPNIPDHVTEQVHTLFQSLIEQVQAIEVRTVTRRESVRQIGEGQTVIYDEGEGPILYTRRNGKIYRQTMQQVNENTLAPMGENTMTRDEAKQPKTPDFP